MNGVDKVVDKKEEQILSFSTYFFSFSEKKENGFSQMLGLFQ